MLEYLYLLPDTLFASPPVYRPHPLVLMFIDFSIVIGSDSFCPYTSECVHQHMEFGKIPALLAILTSGMNCVL